MPRLPVPLLVLAAALLAASPGQPRRLGEAKPLDVGGGREVYGAAPTLAQATPLAALLRDPERFAGRRVQLVADAVEILGGAR